jgi:hypothetical protein
MSSSCATAACSGYDRLLIATGAEPRPLSLFDGAPNAYLLRTAADAGRLRAALRPGTRLIVVGAGFIGQEVAATARALGVEVTVLEAMDAPLTGLLGHEVGSWFADLHGEEGVDLRCGVTAVGTRRDGRGRITGVATADGHTVPCDLVLSGVGVTPADGWLARSGLGGGGSSATTPAGPRSPTSSRRETSPDRTTPSPARTAAASDVILGAAESCPSVAITVVDGETGDRLALGAATGVIHLVLAPEYLGEKAYVGILFLLGGVVWEPSGILTLLLEAGVLAAAGASVVRAAMPRGRTDGGPARLA